MGSSPKAPQPTAEEIAVERRQKSLLDEEIEENEQRLASLARGRLGKASMLSGAPATRGAVANKAKPKSMIDRK